MGVFEYAIIFADVHYDLKELLRDIHNRSGCNVTRCLSREVMSSGGFFDCGAVALGIRDKNFLIGSSAKSLTKNPMQDGTILADRALQDIGKYGERLSNIFARYSAIITNMLECVALSKPYFYRGF